MKKFIYTLILLSVLFSTDSFSANELWRSKTSGNWNTSSTWEFSTNGGGVWIPATTTFPNSTSSTTNIRTGNTVTVPASTNLTVNPLTIDAGGILTLNAGSSLTVSGTLTLFGTINGSGSIKTTGSPQFNLRNGSSFLAQLVLDLGNVTVINSDAPYIADIRGAISVSANRTLAISGGSYGLRVFGNVTNNGFITGGGSSFIMRGNSFVNTGSISPTNFNFDSTTTLDGGGIWNVSSININTTGNVTINDTVVFGSTGVVNVNVSGKINGAGQYLLLNGTTSTVSMIVFANGILGNSATTNVHTRGSVSIDVHNSGIFNASLNIKNGTTTVLNTNGPYIAILNGPILIDATTTLNVNGGGYTLLAYSNVTNNGTISGGGSAFTMKGSTFINNSLINVTTFNFDSTTSLSGTGSWSGSDININSSGNISIAGNGVSFGSSISLSFNVNTGGTFNPNTRTVNFNGTANTINFNLNGGATSTNSGLIQTLGTVNMDLKNGSSFNTALKVNTGVTTCFNTNSPFVGNLFNTLTIDATATFRVLSSGYTIVANSNVINNGILTGPGSSFTMLGNSLVNNGSVNPTNLNFNKTTSISGSGSWNPADLNINSNTTVTLLNNMSFGGSGVLNIDIAGGSLNPNTFTATFDGSQNTVNFILNNLSAILNSGTLQTRGVVNLDLKNGSQFLVPFTAVTGTSTFFNSNSPFEAIINNTVTVDTGAVMNVLSSGYTLTLNENVTNNGTISGAGSTVSFRSQNFTNNGVVSVLNFIFEGIVFSPTYSHTLQGTGIFTSQNCVVEDGSLVTMTTNHQFSFITINNGGTLDISGKSFKLFGAGTPMTVNGFLLTSGSTIEYNGIAAQNLVNSNVEYENLRINDTAGVTVSGNFNIPGTLQLISGDLNLNGKVINFLTTGSLTETPGNTITGNSGYLITTRNINAPVNLNVAGFGAVISTTANLGLTEIKRGPMAQTLFSGVKTIRRYYTVKPVNNSNLNATLVFKYDDSELNGNNESLLNLYKSTNAGATYVFEGGTLNAALNQITLNNINSYARYTAASAFGFANITCLIEGYYNLSTGTLNMKDTITVQLRNQHSPFNVIDSATGTLDSVTFTASNLKFYNAPTDTYYVVVNQRNSIQTWSKSGGEVYTIAGTLNYNFSDLQSKAFGNNMVQVGVKWTDYSGDVNQNGFIDLADVIQVNNSASNFTTGYVSADVNGNRIVDLEDVLLAYNNSINFVSVKKP